MRWPRAETCCWRWMSGSRRWSGTEKQRRMIINRNTSTSVALLLYQRDGSEEALKEALERAEDALDRGEIDAVDLCVDICMSSKPPNVKKALEWAEEALYFGGGDDRPGRYQKVLKAYLAQEKPAAAQLREEGIAAYKADKRLLGISFLQEAAAEQDTEAMMQLYMIYADEDGKPDSERAQEYLELLHKNAEQGQAAARYTCVLLSLKGKGKELDQDTQRRWLLSAAEQGITGAQHEYGKLLGWDKGSEWLLKAAEQGYAEAQLFCAQRYRDLGDLEKALHWAQKAGDAGHKDGALLCQHISSEMKKREGDAACQAGDHARAFDLYHEAFSIGDAGLAHTLAEMCLEGKGTERSVQRALEFYEAACDRGNSDSWFWLGQLYDQGRGVAQDKSKAVELYRKVSEDSRLFPDAKLREAEMFASGDGVKQSDGTARDCMRSLVENSPVGGKSPVDFQGTETGSLLRLRVGLARYYLGFRDDFTTRILEEATDYVNAFLPLSVLYCWDNPVRSQSYFFRWLSNIKPGDAVRFGGFPQQSLYLDELPRSEVLSWTVLSVDHEQRQALLLADNGLFLFDPHTCNYRNDDCTLSEMLASASKRFEYDERTFVAQERCLTPEEYERFILREKLADEPASATIYARTWACHYLNIRYIRDKQTGSVSIKYHDLYATPTEEADGKHMEKLMVEGKFPWWLSDEQIAYEGRVCDKNRLTYGLYPETAAYRPAVLIRWPDNQE